MENLQWIGLSEAKIAETLKNSALTSLLEKIVAIAKEQNVQECEKQKGIFFYQIATKLKPQCHKFLPILTKYVINDGIRNEVQLVEACNYLLEKSTTDVIDEAEFKERCGVGVSVSEEQVEDMVKQVLNKYKEELLRDRYQFPIGKLLGEVRQLLKWADGSRVKQEVDMQILILLGPKTQIDIDASLSKKKKTDQPKVAAKLSSASADKKNTNAVVGDEKDRLVTPSGDFAESMEELLRSCPHFHKVGENFKTDGYVVTPNTMKLLKEHVKKVGGKVMTRFPPEPNGVLHIGHAKAINVNFGLAKALGGHCVLRYDDTNPEKEEERFFNEIKEMVEWLGYKPYKITHSSDYFDQLYRWAVELIKKNLAYVCHQSVDEMRGFDQKPSPWRERSIDESLDLFQKMKNGVFDENECTLRLKVTLEEGKMDPVAYRIKYLPHHRTKNQWCIYPTYDYTHCLCDSIENITHSLCTKEFQSRRSSYYWLCNALDIYCPVQWEYSRLNMENILLSKRKILKLIEDGIVSDWDDPRLFTLTALRRRGIPPEAINKFVARLGLTVAQTTIRPSLLDATVREYLNIHAPRVMAVLEPVVVNIVNYDQLDLPSTVIEVSLFPPEISSATGVNLKDSSITTNRIHFDRTLFIEAGDFQEVPEKGFRRLSVKQPVGLKHVGVVITVESLKKDVDGRLLQINVHAQSAVDSDAKPKAFIHWVAKPVNVEARTFERFERDIEEGREELSISPMQCFKNALIDESVVSDGPCTSIIQHCQFERLGFFAVDHKSSTGGRIVFNQIVPLKDAKIIG